MATERTTIFSLLISLLVLMLFNSLSGKCDATAMKYELQDEAEALLKWKGSLLQSEALLHSWSLPTADGSPCNWTGITCNDDGKVKEINLSNCSLQGKLDPLSFSSLPDLVRLDLSINALSGNIPSQIGASYHLVFLDLSMNQLSGALPLSLANLTLISVLNISDNILGGEISPLLFVNWTSLSHLQLDQNQLSDNQEGNPVIDTHDYNTKSYALQKHLGELLLSLSMSEAEVITEIRPTDITVTPVSVRQILEGFLLCARGTRPQFIFFVDTIFKVLSSPIPQFHVSAQGMIPGRVDSCDVPLASNRYLQGNLCNKHSSPDCIEKSIIVA
ncbi:hypothetical protein MRB53_015827 [Persea americana]|uniref:Uncharacterized protein n=1 Tax=Persea americana TaxID=3435 RepID=A0ACC2M0Z1_PERAE|nr:hypothetical protein MRB53_015827 [Persea americana]